MSVNIIIPSTSWAVNDRIKRGETLAVFFHLTGCGHCHESAEVLQDEVLPNVEINVYGINLAYDQSLALPLNIDGTPTLIVFSDGAPVGRLDGSQDAETYLKLLSGVSVDEDEGDEEGEDPEESEY